MNHLLHRPAPGKWSSAAFSVLMHGGLFLLLFYGVQWQRREEAPVAVQLVASLPPLSQPAPPVPPAPQPVRPEPRPEPPPPPVAKPDIELKAPEKKPLPQKKEEPKPEPPKPEPARKEPPKPTQSQPVPQPEKKPAPKPEPAKPDRMQQLLAQENQRLENARAEALLNADNSRKSTVVSNVRGLEEREGVLGGWKHQVQERVRSRMGVLPPGITGCPTAVFEVELLPVGLIKREPVRIKSSGSEALDDMIRRAIIASEPFPKPPDEAVGKPNRFEFDPKNCKQR
ncbi:MAG: hypothetical protein CGU28_10450 [Candidatus Dactylopiibacterium carminicum]|uniref:TonB C-terminal domain-containing protein n=1 Tax=Candidatus Dactylopiibacterium carminicum TaxID=857335 RepID=A0A272EQQ6_9RHOO|nr:TonB C-terminal domain-containing protein [Candidatus Dactylopiibacterium carminicum]KAF7598645.1 TonB C-terminal domain-containing protein [Candidatus Dactylopiibacterium carminicum]PAS92411.1 MAG: hypothetical protein CGU29_11805 [Candidatus Dactylopiibacterium carminicum]PAS95996.1 MAG: hypothetical protein CGU28_10450 [Candidatus Dactylopiibacterium carminicum]PAS98412.1 MAG: hypothetical protein BSR46_12265 [Candidatus Dactylopiibacterium carminicum]